MARDFDVLGRTWVICGSFEVVASPTSSDKVLMCELNQSQYYQYEFTSRIREYREKYTDASIVKALSIVEESFRSKAIELTRSGSKVPWGGGGGCAYQGVDGVHAPLESAQGPSCAQERGAIRTEKSGKESAATKAPRTPRGEAGYP